MNCGWPCAGGCACVGVECASASLWCVRGGGSCSAAQSWKETAGRPCVHSHPALHGAGRRPVSVGHGGGTLDAGGLAAGERGLVEGWCCNVNTPTLGATGFPVVGR